MQILSLKVGALDQRDPIIDLGSILFGETDREPVLLVQPRCDGIGNPGHHFARAHLPYGIRLNADGDPDLNMALAPMGLISEDATK